MLTITPIGSCRVATPLRLARDSHGFRINTKRIYGYSHSCAEAVQQMQFLHNEFTPSPQLWSMMSRRDIMDPRVVAPHSPSDVYIVELSSAKIISVGDQIVQLNYLKSKFADFFSDPQRTRQFAIYAKANAPDDLEHWLSEVWNQSQNQRSEAETLRQIRIESTTRERLCADMTALQSGLGEVLFVTHVDAVNTQGFPVPGRGEFIAQVREAGRLLDLPVFDPTTAMREVGQAVALADHSTALAHFTDQFSKLLLDRWYNAAIHDVIERLVLDRPTEAISRIIVPHTRAFFSSDNRSRLNDIALLLDALESEFPSNKALKGLQFELALARGAEPEVKRCFLQTAVEGDLRQVPDLEAHLDRINDTQDWLWDLSGAPILASGTQQWLAQFAKVRGWHELAEEFEYWISDPKKTRGCDALNVLAAAQKQTSVEVYREPAT